MLHANSASCSGCGASSARRREDVCSTTGRQSAAIRKGRTADGSGKTRKVVEPQRPVFAGANDSAHGALAESRNAQQLLAGRLVDVDREAAAIAQRPGKL